MDFIFSTYFEAKKKKKMTVNEILLKLSGFGGF